MDAIELLSGEEPFVFDTSAWSRVRRLPSDLAPQLRAAMIAG
jgi:hypothetical protein